MNKEEKEFWHRFKRWHLNDIDKTIQVEAYVGAAKLICCAIDSLAGFRFGAIDYRNSQYRFVQFVKEYMPFFKRRLKLMKNGKIVYRRSVLQMFYKNFRSGLIHEGLPGIGTSIINHKDKGLLFITPTPDLLQINITGLFAYLKHIFLEYEKKLLIQGDEEIVNNFRKRLLYITDINQISKMK